MNKKPLPTIGVDKYTFFKVNEDSVSGTEYGEAYNLKGTVEIAPTDSGGSDVLTRTMVHMSVKLYRKIGTRYNKCRYSAGG